MDRLIRFGKDVMNGWLEADAFTLAAALAYYAIFSIAPLLLIAIHIASFFLDRTVVVEGLTNELAGVIGPSGSDAITQMLEAAGTGQPEGWTGIVGIAVLLFAATGFVGSLQDALDKIWNAPPRPGGLWSFIQSKFLIFQPSSCGGVPTAGLAANLHRCDRAGWEFHKRTGTSRRNCLSYHRGRELPVIGFDLRGDFQIRAVGPGHLARSRRWRNIHRDPVCRRPLGTRVVSRSRG